MASPNGSEREVCARSRSGYSDSMTLLAIIVGGAAALSSIPAMVFFVECVASLFLVDRIRVAEHDGLALLGVCAEGKYAD